MIARDSCDLVCGCSARTSAGSSCAAGPSFTVLFAPLPIVLGIIIPLAIYLEGRGLAFFRQVRVGKDALNWTRLSCHRFVANQVRLWLFVLAYNLGNFMRRLTLPESVKHWSLRSVQTKLIKMGGRLVRHARRLVFQLAEVAVSREVFRQVLERIAGLHPAPG